MDKEAIEILRRKVPSWGKIASITCGLIYDKIGVEMMLGWKQIKLWWAVIKSTEK